MTCTELAPLLIARALDLADRPAEIDAHVAGCDACRELARGRVAACADALRLPGAASASDGWEALAARIEAHRARQQLKIALSCAYCHAELERAAAAFCAGCLAPHHDECFTEHGRCSAPGCAEVRVVRPGAPTRARRRWAPWLTFAGGLAVAAAALSPSAPWASRPSSLVVEVQRPRDAREARERQFSLGPVLTLAVSDASGADVVARIAAAAGQTIDVDPRARDRRITLAMTGDWLTVMHAVAKELHCDFASDDDGGFRLSPISRSVTVRRVDETVRVTVRCVEEDVRDVVADLAAAGGRDLIVDTEFHGAVTLQLTDIHWLQALHSIVKTVGEFELVEESPTLLRIVPMASIEAQTINESYALKNTGGEQAKDLVRLLAAVIEQRRAVDPNAAVALDERTNTVIFTSSDRALRLELRRLLEERDVPR